MLHVLQGIVSGVLLVTPHSVMFQPNVSDPLVMDRGIDAYAVTAQMSAITGAAMYHDIAAMAIHDPLKTGRFVAVCLFHRDCLLCQVALSCDEVELK